MTKNIGEASLIAITGALLAASNLALAAAPPDAIARAQQSAETLSRDYRLSRATILIQSLDGNATLRFGLPNEEPARTDAVYELASISKVFTGILLARTVQERPEISLDSAVENHLPELRGSDVGAATLRELATHRSGLPLTLCTTQGHYSLPDAAAFLNAVAQVRIDRSGGKPPRSYSDAGYAVLGLALERIHGLSYDELLRTRLLDPLKMTSTGSAREDLRAAAPEGHVVTLEKVPAQRYGVYAAAAGVRSTSSDLRRLLEACVNPPESSAGRAIRLAAAEGLGWDSPPGATTLFKNAGAGGYSAWIHVDPSEGFGILMLNAINSNASEALLWNLLGKAEAPSEPVPTILPAVVPGIYTADGNRTPRLTIEIRAASSNQPVPSLRAPDGGRYRISAAGPGWIQIEDGWTPAWRAQLNCDPDVCVIEWRSNGKTLRFTKPSSAAKP